MAIRAWIAGLIALTLVPASASALTISVAELNGGGASTIVAVGRDGVTGGDVGTTFPGLPGLADLNSDAGQLTFNFATGSHSGSLQARQTISADGIFVVSEVSGFVSALTDAPPIIQIFQSAANFSPVFGNVILESTADSISFNNADSFMQVASFYSSSNFGGSTGTDELKESDGSGNPLDVGAPIVSSIVCSTPGSPVFCAGSGASDVQTFSTVAVDNFSLNHQLTIGLQNTGDFVSFNFVTVSQIPLPAPMLLLLSGIAGVGAVGVRRRLRQSEAG